MSIGRTQAANSLFLNLWNETKRDLQEQPSKKTDQQKAMEKFAEVMQDCDKAMENVMDAHHKSVAESAKKQAEHRKQLAKQERIQRAADERELLNERAAIEALNRRNVLEDLRIDDMYRRENFNAQG